MVEKLCSYPNIRYLDVARPAWLYTDVSNFSIGAVLRQIDEHGREYVCEFLAEHYVNMKRITQLARLKSSL